jgi:hypothetical protein
MQFRDGFDTGSVNGSSSGTSEVGGAGPGSKAFGDQLHHVMQSVGVDNETITTVLGGLNNGQAEGAESDASGLDTLMSKLDTDSSARLQDDGASLEQLIRRALAAPRVTAPT